MTDREIAIKYLPRFYIDKREPFEINAIGYTVYREDGYSPSFPRNVKVDKTKFDFMVEYAIFWTLTFSIYTTWNTPLFTSIMTAR